MTTDRRWTLTPAAFDTLLQRLGTEREAAAAEYETIRRKLLDFFDWRGAAFPEGLADETLDRVARKLAEGEQVEHLRAYFYGVAKLVLLEAHKRRQREEAALDDPRVLPPEDQSASETRIECLEGCLRELPEDARELIVAYYVGPGKAHLEGRKLLAERVGVSYGTLKTRAHRLRGRLEQCLGACLRRSGGRNQ